MVEYSPNLNEFAKLNGLDPDEVLTKELEEELGEGELVDNGEELH